MKSTQKGIEQMVNEEVLEMIANVLEMCIDELDESIDEEFVRTHRLGRSVEAYCRTDQRPTLKTT
jgi:hypothetical protein